MIDPNSLPPVEQNQAPAAEVPAVLHQKVEAQRQMIEAAPNVATNVLQRASKAVMEFAAISSQIKPHKD